MSVSEQGERRWFAKHNGYFQHVWARAAENAGLVLLHGELLMPDRFEAVVDDERYPIVNFVGAQLRGRTECVNLSVAARDGERLTAAELRLPIDRFLREATSVVAARPQYDAAGNVVFHVPAWLPAAGEPVSLDLGADGVVNIFGAPESTEHQRREIRFEASYAKRQKVDAARLEKIATTYRSAIRMRQSPIEAIAAQEHVSRSRAAALVMKCREFGYLGKTRKGKAGEETDDG